MPELPEVETSRRGNRATSGGECDPVCGSQEWSVTLAGGGRNYEVE